MKTKRKMYPWKDKKYLEETVRRDLGIEDKKCVAQRYFKLAVDIYKIEMQMHFYNFRESNHKTVDLFYTFIRELRELNNRPERLTIEEI
jgi:hypothetical protein